MKRSKALGKIYDILYPYVDLTDDCEYVTNEILDELEKLGMSPPSYVLNKQGSVWHCEEVDEWEEE